MRKASSSEETEQESGVRKRRPRGKSEPREAKNLVGETRTELEEQLQELQAKIGALDRQRKQPDPDSYDVEHCNRLEDQTHSGPQDATNRGEESVDNAAARKQVEAQRQRLEEALLIAQERKRAEEPIQNSEIDSTNGVQCGNEETWMPSLADSKVNIKGIDVVNNEKGIAPLADDGDLVGHVLERLNSNSPGGRASALNDLSKIAGNKAFAIISKAFDDASPEVRNAAARALYSLESDPASTFALALREANPQRRRQIGQSLAASGLASDAIRSLADSSLGKNHEALALLFLMAKAGEIKPLMNTIEDGQDLETRLAVINLLALSGRSEIIPPFRRLAVRGSLPAEVRSAVMEAIYQMTSQQRERAGRQ